MSSAADLERALAALSGETSHSRLLSAACRELAQLLGAARVSVSRTIGDLLVELCHHDARGGKPPLELFLVTDYPLTQEVIETREPRTVVLGAPDADPAESAVLEQRGFRTLLMLPLRSRGQNWGLVEIYGDERAYGDEDAALAADVVERVGELLGELETHV